MTGNYLVWKTLHVIGAVLMVGNVTVTGAWAILLWRAGDGVPLRQIARWILWTDLLFTAIGGSLMTFSGIQMIRIGQIPWRQTPWLLRGIAALGVSSAIWLLLLLPDQIRMERCDPADRAGFRRYFVRWGILGWTATAVLFWGVWVMVRKPT